MRYWLLQANPKTWDIDRFFRDGRTLESFVVVVHLKEITAGDRFLIWKAGPSGGVVGEGTVTGAPRPISTSRPDGYWLKNAPDSDAIEIPIRVDDLWLEDPLPRESLLHDPLLSQCTIVKAPQSGNPFAITDQQWQRLQQMLSDQPLAPGTDADWDLAPGTALKRTDLHKSYGGSGQNGITRSSSTPNVLIFTDPSSGEQHGYFDQWGEDGFFYYSGEGQRGDQTLTAGNKAILEAADQGRALRLFEGAKGTVRYVGEFSLDPSMPYIEVQAPETGGGPLRRVYQFRLWPIDQPGGTALPANGSVGAPYASKAEDIEVEPPSVRRSQDPDAYGRGLRLHRKVERQLAESIERQGWAPLQPSVSDPPFDLAWFTSDLDITLVEVKSINKRNEAKQLRLGIGQILDYAETMRRRGLSVTPILHLSHPPTDERWTTICERAQITLTWAPHSH